MTEKLSVNEVSDQDDFWSLRKSILENVELNIRQIQSKWETQQEIGNRIFYQIEQFYKDSGLDIARLNSIKESESKKLEETFTQLTQQYAEKSPTLKEKLQDNIESANSYSHSGWSQAFLIGADLITEPENLDAYKGEKGNPSVWLHDPHWPQKMKQTAEGDSKSCEGQSPYHTTMLWYYSWLPPLNNFGTYDIDVQLSCNGFYKVYAWPHPACSYAIAEIDVTLQAYQKFGANNVTVLVNKIENLLKVEGSYIFTHNTIDLVPSSNISPKKSHSARGLNPGLPPMVSNPVVSSTFNYMKNGAITIVVMLSLIPYARGWGLSILDFESGAYHVEAPYVYIRSRFDYAQIQSSIFEKYLKSLFAFDEQDWEIDRAHPKCNIMLKL